MDIGEQYIEYLAEPVAYGNKVRQRSRQAKVWRDFEPVETKPLVYDNYPTSESAPKMWFSSDHHFGHKNIIKFSNRPYPNLQLMQECLIGNHNNVVSEQDIWICVGDFAFLPDSVANDILDQMNGYKVLVIGNHDINKKKVKRLNFDAIYPSLVLTLWDIEFFVSHYPFEYIEPGVFNIHGHQHVNHETVTGLPFFNVNVEFHNYKPVSSLTIVEQAKKRIGSFE